MAEYIDRDKAIRMIEAQCVNGKMFGSEEADMTLIDAYALIDKLQEIPSENVTPVVHGRWIRTPKHIQCSECGKEYVFYKKYCPNCGANMREINDLDGDV